jgi:hypothetical protein
MDTGPLGARRAGACGRVRIAGGAFPERGGSHMVADCRDCLAGVPRFVGSSNALERFY